jgi:Cys-rich repeat protein
MKHRRPTLLALLLPVSVLALLAGSCGSDKKSAPSAATSTCSLAGVRCQFGCSDTLGCVQCQSNTDCAPGAPVCALGRCAACGVNGDCGTGEACFPANHSCQTACTTNAECPQFGGQNATICDTASGACVQCRDDADCPATAPKCEPNRRQCGDCASRADCGIAAPACNLQNARCVECLVDADCNTGGRPYACGDDNQCHPLCQADTDCTAPNRTHCNLANGLCVECLLAANCPTATPICNPADNQCVQCTTNAECPAATPICAATGPTQNRCVQCTTDAECRTDGGNLTCTRQTGMCG